MKKQRRLFFILALLFVALFALLQGLPQKGFHPSKVRSPLPSEKSWECSLPQTSHFDRLLAQKFHYMGSGAQMYVFLGEDDKTVLKLFKMDRLLPKKWLKHLPVPSALSAYKMRKTTAREKRLKATFASCKLAIEQFREETGLLHVQLNPKRDDLRKIHVIDKKSRSHYIPLRDTPFILQQKAELIYTRFRKRLNQGKLEILKEEQEAILQLVEQRLKKGIADDDSGVSQNFGFIGDRPVQIDFGELYLKTMLPSDAAKAREHVHTKMTRWLSQSNHY